MSKNNVKNIDNKAMAMVQFVHTALPEARLEAENLLTMNRNGFFYLFICSENSVIVCVCKIIHEKIQATKADVLKQFNSYANFGSSSFQMVDEKPLFLYRSEFILDTELTTEQFNFLFHEIEREIGMVYGVIEVI